MRQENSQKDPQKQKILKKGKQPLVINTELEYKIFIAKLQHLAKNQIPVMMNPSVRTMEALLTDARNQNHFLKTQYDPNCMSHVIISVMPKMKTTVSLSENPEQYHNIQENDTQNSIDEILDTMLEARKKKEEEERSE